MRLSPEPYRGTLRICDVGVILNLFRSFVTLHACWGRR